MESFKKIIAYGMSSQGLGVVIDSESLLILALGATALGIFVHLIKELNK